MALQQSAPAIWYMLLGFQVNSGASAFPILIEASILCCCCTVLPALCARWLSQQLPLPRRLEWKIVISHLSAHHESYSSDLVKESTSSACC